MLICGHTTDGPKGARGESYISGIKAACFPCATSVGASLDTELLHRIGQEIAAEAKTKSANVLSAPTLNVIRSPLGKSEMIQISSKRLTGREFRRTKLRDLF
jgi:beta-glucosidase